MFIEKNHYFNFLFYRIVTKFKKKSLCSNRKNNLSMYPLTWTNIRLVHLNYCSSFKKTFIIILFIIIELKKLANLLKCPVLSCDSDFLIYDLKYGYISTDFIEMNIEKLKTEIDEMSSLSMEQETDAKFEPYLPARLYKIDTFLDNINAKISNINCHLKKEMLPIFAVLNLKKKFNNFII